MGNPGALKAIPAGYLGPANLTPGNNSESAVVNEEDDLEEQEGGAEPDSEGARAGPSGSSISFAAVGCLLVDRAVSPACLPPRMASPPPSADRVEMPWVNPTHFSGTSFFTDPIVIAFVEDPTRQTTRTRTHRNDSWMCGNLNISDAWHHHFMQYFPKLAFGQTNNQPRLWWEWVS
jgi:hypothetical protein